MRKYHVTPEKELTLVPCTFSNYENIARIRIQYNGTDPRTKLELMEDLGLMETEKKKIELRERKRAAEESFIYWNKLKDLLKDSEPEKRENILQGLTKVTTELEEIKKESSGFDEGTNARQYYPEIANALFEEEIDDSELKNLMLDEINRATNDFFLIMEGKLKSS